MEIPTFNYTDSPFRLAIDPCRTAKAIGRDGWFHTGDLAAVDARGRFYIRGRLNNVILGAAGENIYPEEIEFVISSYPGVGESLVVERGRNLVGVVRMEEDASHDSLAEAAKFILEYVNKRVNKQSALARIEMLTEPFKKTAQSSSNGTVNNFTNNAYMPMKITGMNGHITYQNPPIFPYSAISTDTMKPAINTGIIPQRIIFAVRFPFSTLLFFNISVHIYAFHGTLSFQYKVETHPNSAQRTHI